MKIEDLKTLSDNDIRKIADKVLQQKEENVGEGDNQIGKESVTLVNDIDGRLGTDLLITISYIEPALGQSLSMHRFWGHSVRIDINGMESKEMRKSHENLRNLIIEGIKKYIDISTNVPYGYVDFDSLK